MTTKLRFFEFGGFLYEIFGYLELIFSFYFSIFLNGIGIFNSELLFFFFLETAWFRFV